MHGDRRCSTPVVVGGGEGGGGSKLAIRNNEHSRTCLTARHVHHDK